MSDTDRIKKPNEKAKDRGDEFVKLASWGMLPQLAIGSSLNRLKSIIIMSVYGLVVAVIIFYQYPFAAELKSLLALIVGMTGAVISVWGILRGTENLFLEERFRRKVVIYPANYELDQMKVLVTIINVGDPLIVREVSLIVGWVEVNSPFSILMGKGLMNFTRLGDAALFAGCMPMNESSIWRIQEDHIRNGLLDIASWLGKYLQTVLDTNPDVYVVVTDRYHELERTQEEQRRPLRRRRIQGLISICCLGEFNHLLAEAQNKEGIRMFEMKMEFPEQMETGAIGRMTRYVPPIMPSEHEYRGKQMQTLHKILEKLDAIQKIQEEMRDKLKPKKKRRINKH